MSSVISKIDLYNDCHLLFGPEVWVSDEFLSKLLPSELKAAYRKKALETHPDRAKSLGKADTEMHWHFKEVSIAYERLNSFLNGDKISILKEDIPKQRKKKKTTAREKNKKTTTRQKSEKTTTRQKRKRPVRTAWPGKKVFDHFYKGHIPKRRLLLGQYLYYSGVISWRTLFKAILWQRKQRPLIGQIALDWGILSTDDIKEILTERDYNENFGEYAKRKGYINYFEFLALLGKQHMLQRPLGEYFVQNGILSDEEMDEIVEKLRIHNKEISDTKPAR